MSFYKNSTQDYKRTAMHKSFKQLISLSLIVFSMNFISGCGDNQSNFIPPDGMTRLTDDTITKMIGDSTGHLLVHFTSYDEGCGYCMNSNLYIEEVMQNYKDKLKVARISWEPWRSYAKQSKAIKKEYLITGVPMVVLYKDGKELWRATGDTPENDIKLTELLTNCCR